MANITIKNLDNAEDNAMLCALRSRSSSPIHIHLDKVEETGSGKFMEKYYVGYGHRSISQCGTTTVHLDNISILAAKAIEESQLFNGQECSSRYLDFSNRETYVDHEIIRDWLEFYTNAKEPLVAHLKFTHPNETELESVYEKNINATAFDILRGFLPAAVTTNVSWHTTLDNLREQIDSFKFHPLKEVNEIANRLHELAIKEFPHSFKDKEMSEETMSYNTELSNFWYSDNIFADDFRSYSNIDDDLIDPIILDKRPKYAPLPKTYKFMGEFRFEFNLDYGSFRDIQRHRSCLIYQPLLTAKLGFHEWYLDQLSPELKIKALELIERQSDKIQQLSLEIDAISLQYCIPLGMKISVSMIANLSALVYVLELRSSPHVHPTLRELIFKMVDDVTKKLPSLKLHIDVTNKDGINTQRGSQDITEKVITL